MTESRTLKMLTPSYDFETGKLYCGHAIEVLQKMSAESVDCVITSPPYFALRSYTDDEREIGKETNPYDFVQSLVEVFREVRRVLKSDGTLWLNLGDTYMARNKGNLKQKDLIGIPWRVAFALQEDGWWLRQDIIWQKPNPMPESIRDRCTKAHEYIFLLTKSKKYFYDNEAIKEPVKQDWGTRNRKNGKYHKEGSGLQPHSGLEKSYKTKNKRSVWTIAPKPFKGAHFATFPPKLIEPCILAGTSAKGNCSACGAPIKRIVETNNPSKQSADYDNDLNWANTNQKTSNPQSSKSLHRNKGGVYSSAITKGWKSTCECNAEIRPSIVLDPFVGSGTTCVVAKEHGRHFIGIDLNEEYLALANDRITNS